MTMIKKYYSLGNVFYYLLRYFKEESKGNGFC